MIELQPDKGIPRRLLFMMAAMAGLTVANLYYNQPLLELMRADIGMGEVEANMVTVVTQAGYALGLCLIMGAFKNAKYEEETMGTESPEDVLTEEVVPPLPSPPRHGCCGRRRS